MPYPKECVKRNRIVESNSAFSTSLSIVIWLLARIQLEKMARYQNLVGSRIFLVYVYNFLALRISTIIFAIRFFITYINEITLLQIILSLFNLLPLYHNALFKESDK